MSDAGITRMLQLSLSDDLRYTYLAVFQKPPDEAVVRVVIPG